MLPFISLVFNQKRFFCNLSFQKVLIRGCTPFNLGVLIRGGSIGTPHFRSLIRGGSILTLLSQVFIVTFSFRGVTRSGFYYFRDLGSILTPHLNHHFRGVITCRSRFYYNPNFRDLIIVTPVWEILIKKAILQSLHVQGPN